MEFPYQDFLYQDFSAHPGPALRQGQWNVIKLGNPLHAGQCKKQRFKNIRIEAIDLTAPKTIPIMTHGVINVSLLEGND